MNLPKQKDGGGKMKKKIFIIFIILLNAELYSQGGWELIYSGESIYGSLYKDAIFFNDNTGWVLAQYKLYKTTNACQSFSKYAFPEIANNYMVGMQFLNINTGWVNVDKYLKFTTNSGLSWITIDTNFYGIKDFYFTEPVNGWYCGSNGLIRKTTNSGYSWVSLNSGVTENLNAVAFADNNFGVCAGDWGKILWTTNGGLNWNQFTDIYTNFFTNIKFLNNQTCIVTGTGNIIYRTTNRGSDWQPYFSNYSIQNSIQVDQSNSVFIFGTPFAYLKSTSSGASWIQNNANGLFSKVIAASITYANNFWCAADSGIIFRSSNSGNDWDIVHRDYLTKENLKSVYFVNSVTGFASGGYGKLLSTTNGGVNWSIRTLNSNSIFNTVTFINNSTGFIGGAQGAFGIVLKTTDSGVSWNNVYADSLPITCLHFINQNTGFGAGYTGVFIKTTNSGNNWIKSVIDFPIFSNTNDIFFLNESTGFIGRGGLYKTSNGGINWYRVLIYQTQSLQFFGNTGYAITSVSGNFQKTTNYGENWTTYPTGGSYRGDLFFINTETGWINTGSSIRKTTNGGVNWSVQNTNENSIAVNSIFFY
ncbi:MAG: Serine/threonine protein kinase [Chlorobi bacterium OLB5]|nr:MAG: Serine/threonine protein kinase [Chlorobi bacterium OLB5]